MKNRYDRQLLSANVAFLQFFWNTIQSNTASPTQLKVGFQMFLDAQQVKTQPQVSDRDSFRGGRKQGLTKKEKTSKRNLQQTQMAQHLVKTPVAVFLLF